MTFKHLVDSYIHPLCITNNYYKYNISTNTKIYINYTHNTYNNNNHIF